MSEVRTKTDESSNDRLVPRSVGRSMLLSVVGLSLILLVGMEIQARQDNYPVTFPFNSDITPCSLQLYFRSLGEVLKPTGLDDFS